MPRARLLQLVLDRIGQLNNEMLGIHNDLSVWRATPYTDIEKTKLSVRFDQASKELHDWLEAMNDEMNGLT